MAGAAFTPPFKLVLGSGSPRRRALLEAMGLSFRVCTSDIEESYPPSLKGPEITDYLCLQKSEALLPQTGTADLLLTADTIVWYEGAVMEKPAGIEEARETLMRLSGNWHQVITSVCFRQVAVKKVLNAVTEVKFAPLDAAMVEAYFKKGHPLDKAGAYGIQEWIGLTAIEGIRGSYTNVVGLPTQLVYKTLRDMGFPLL
ncbi:MAG: Maf family nucleotide pyrophosphatase [Robiginitalea sp.]